MNYQKFANEESSSNSHGKFEALRINGEMFNGKNVLDIGCNEGYFCFKSVNLGARKVIGLDKTHKWIELARSRNTYDNLEFVHGDISYIENLPDNSIDIVMILSALHYMCMPQDLVDEIPKIIIEASRILSNNGILIFEGGIILEDNNINFVEINRAIGDTVFYPTKKHLEHIFNSYFRSYNFIGPSIKQAGDPINRFVYHARK